MPVARQTKLCPTIGSIIGENSPMLAGGNPDEAATCWLIRRLVDRCGNLAKAEAKTGVPQNTLGAWQSQERAGRIDMFMKAACKLRRTDATAHNAFVADLLTVFSCGASHVVLSPGQPTRSQVIARIKQQLELLDSLE